MLAFISSYLKPAQDVNVALDKKKQILAALNIRGLSDNEVAEQYKSIVESDDVINSDNQILTKAQKEESRPDLN